MADLYTYVTGRMGTAHLMNGGVLHTVENGGGGALLADGNVHGGYLGQGVDTGLEVCEGFTKGEVCIRCQGSRAEGRNENCLGRGVRSGHDAVGTLDEGTPQTGLQEKVLGFLGRFGSFGTEVHELLVGIGLYQNCQQFSLFAPDDSAYRTADRRGEQNLGTLFVGHHGGACLHRIALLHQQSGNQTLEVGGLDSYDVRNHGFDDLRGCNTLHRNVEALFQSEIV